MHTGSYSVSAALLNQTRKSTVAFFATDPLRWVSARRTLIGGGFSGAAGERAAADRVRSGCPRGGQFFGDPVSPVECPRGGQGKWLVLPNPRGGRGAADMVWHASCPRGGQVFWVGASPFRVRGADRVSGWFCSIRKVGGVPRTGCGMRVVRGADSFSGLRHHRLRVRWADRLSGWFSQTAGERAAADRVWQAECPRRGISEWWMAAFF